MEYVRAQEELTRLSNKQIELAEEYRKARMAFGEARHNLQVFLVPRQKIPKYQKASLERQIMMLTCDLDEEGDTAALKLVNGAREDLIKSEQEYKGLEKLLEAYTSRITVFQSLMRWQREHI